MMEPMDAADLFKSKPTSLLHSIAEHFQNDSRDFAIRFDVLWENGSLLHKMGRTGNRLHTVVWSPGDRTGRPQ